MATVYSAYDPGIDRPLAVKFLHPEMCVDDEDAARASCARPRPPAGCRTRTS